MLLLKLLWVGSIAGAWLGTVSRAEAQPAGGGAGGAARVVKTKGQLYPPLRFGRLGMENGLPNQTVHAIVQDQQGFMWFGTEAGLARWDGYEMVVFQRDPQNPKTIASHEINSLTVDGNGTLWVGTDEGLDRFDAASETFHHLVHDPNKQGTIANNSVTAMLVASDGSYWVGTSAGVHRFDPKTDSFELIEATNGTAITSLAEISGTLYVGTLEGGLIELDPKTARIQTYLPAEGKNNTISGKEITALVAGDGQLWIGTQEAGLNLFAPATKTFTRWKHREGESASLPDDHITALARDARGELWIGTANTGLARYNPETELFTSYPRNESVPDSFSYHFVTSAYVNSAGVVWAGTNGGGISTCDPLALELSPQRMGGLTAVSIVEQGDRWLWVGTSTGQGAGLYKIDRTTGAFDRYEALVHDDGSTVDLTNVVLTSMHLDSRGLLWIGTWGAGVIALDPKTDEFDHYPFPPEETGINVFWRIIEINGVFWIATHGGGLLRWDPAKNAIDSFTNQSDTNDPRSLNLTTVYQDRSSPNTLWIGGEMGLLKFDIQTEVFTAFRHDPKDDESLSDDEVIAIYQDETGALWVGTQNGGFNRFDPKTGKAKRYAALKELKSRRVYAILPDQVGNLWMSTNGDGLLVFNRETEAITHYTARDGLQNNEFAINASYRGKTGRLYFGGVAGYNAFIPERIKPEGLSHPVVLTHIRVMSQDRRFSEPVWSVDRLGLTHTDAYFSFSFAAPGQVTGARNRYQVMIEGLSGLDQWHEVEQNFQEFNKPPAGDYVFKVRSLDRTGKPSEAVSALKFSVAPPWWRTWWAYTVYGVIVLGIVFAIFRYQQQRIKLLTKENRLSAVERDLELTALVQTGLLPQQPQIDHGSFQACGFYRAAEQCSGDWWWHERTADGMHVVAVGDVTGHGPGPAMITAAACAVFRSYGQAGFTVPERLTVLSKEIMAAGRGEYHMVMTVLELDDRTGKFKMYFAGGLPAMSVHDGKAKVHSGRGYPLGTSSFEPTMIEGEVAPGSRMMLLTDGLPEIALADNKLFGIRRVRDVLVKTHGLGLNDASNRMVTEADAARGTGAQSDDWTFVLVDWDPARASRGQQFAEGTMAQPGPRVPGL